MAGPTKRAPKQQRTDESDDSTTASITDSTSLCETDASGIRCTKPRVSFSYKLRKRIERRWALRALASHEHLGNRDLPLDENSSTSDESYSPSGSSEDSFSSTSSSSTEDRHSDYSSGSFVSSSGSPSTFSETTASNSSNQGSTSSSNSSSGHESSSISGDSISDCDLISFSDTDSDSEI